MGSDHRDDATNGAHSTAEQHNERETLSATEMQDQMDQFTYIMQQRKLQSPFGGKILLLFTYGQLDELEKSDA
ncbi:hypothetical protein CMV_025412 [Castanea mollissima]|uniref:Uncharacterized protein n=1 Tax=Castanea mollissima TaxID=60419 RepID=A0A8J4QG29_9ROSI|nr:hypothetical protein CMV_025412 [Castanea mollissima]